MALPLDFDRSLAFAFELDQKPGAPGEIASRRRCRVGLAVRAQNSIQFCQEQGEIEVRPGAGFRCGDMDLHRGLIGLFRECLEDMEGSRLSEVEVAAEVGCCVFAFLSLFRLTLDRAPG